MICQYLFFTWFNFNEWYIAHFTCSCYRMSVRLTYSVQRSLWFLCNMISSIFFFFFVLLASRGSRKLQGEWLSIVAIPRLITGSNSCVRKLTNIYKALTLLPYMLNMNKCLLTKNITISVIICFSLWYGFNPFIIRLGHYGVFTRKALWMSGEIKTYY